MSIQTAKDNITAEAAPRGAAMQLLASYITEAMLTSDENAALVEAEGKSLIGCMDHIKKYAQDQKSGNAAVVAGDTVIRLLHEYYAVPVDIAAAGSWYQRRFTAALAGGAEAPKPSGLNISLLDLLE